MATTVLETAGKVSVEDHHPLWRDADWQAGIHATRVINATNRRRRRWRLRWEPATHAQVVAVRDHYRTNAAAGGVPVTYTPPQGSAVSVIYSAPIRVQHASYAAATVEVELEEALNTD